MNGKQNRTRRNDTNKNLEFEQSGEAIHEESQNISQISFSELNEKINKLMNSFKKIEEDNKQLMKNDNLLLHRMKIVEQRIDDL